MRSEADGSMPHDPASLLGRLDTLARCTDGAGVLTRLYLTPAHEAAIRLARGWMQQAGLATRLDAAATLVGRLEGSDPDARTLLIGSHLDTVPDAGRYDGALGILAGLAALERLRDRDIRLPFAVELLAFGDEEGVRFARTLTGSRACAGTLDAALHLASHDAEGITLRDALSAFGCDPDRLGDAAYRPDRVIAYLEPHIEQGPVLEQAALPLGVVTAINAASRFIVTVCGEAGHAGTVPMDSRRDALATAAEMIVATRGAGLAWPGVTATVGQIRAWPGGVNVIAGEVEFSLDLRASTDALRDKACAALFHEWDAITAEHGVTHSIAPGFSASAAPCAEDWQARLERAAIACGLETKRLPSGAGHDAMAMAALCPIAMLFVRCRGGISHNPAESITGQDAELAVDVIVRLLEDLAAEGIR
ncbi:allantoate amidohydrolase [Lichenicoccus sp.]|uniref:allantoate amidohydrolase n=1 Tax=Lichenicoccus sp. TaxID=2781899 RepID=UPI003D0BFE42